MDGKAFHVLSMKLNIDFLKYSDHFKTVPLDDLQEFTIKYFLFIILLDKFCDFGFFWSRIEQISKNHIAL